MMTPNDYQSLLIKARKMNPALFNNPVELAKRLNEFDHLIETESDNVAKCILVQGRNLMAIALNKPLIDEIKL